MNNLKILREKKGVSQTEVAEYISVSRQAYNNYEAAKREPSQEILIKLADYFNVSVDYLIGRKNTEKEILPSLSPKEINEISKEAEKVREYINASLMTAFDGKPKDEETLEKVMNALEYGMQLAKQEAKEKYTPKKYKNDKSNND